MQCSEENNLKLGSCKAKKSQQIRFKCKACNKGFCIKVDMNKHLISVHDGKKAFLCKVLVTNKKEADMEENI